MTWTKEILVKDYFDIHNYYSEIYGKNKTIIMMQVGSFHECYSTNNEGLDLIKLAQQLDVVCTKKNSKEEVSKSNPRMIGFPISVRDTFIEKLCNLNLTVILIDQTTNPPKPKREITGIYSPATFIDSKNVLNSKSNNLVSIVIDKKTSKSKELCIGISSYDLTTGYGCYYETYSTQSDLMIALDDTIRFLETYPPNEIILYNTIGDEIINNMNLENMLNYIGCDNKIIYNYDNKMNTKITYQTTIFNNVFKDIKDIFEITELSKYNWARLSLTNLYDYTQNHQINLINNLKLPIYFQNENYLYLGNRALEQLDIIGHNKSLFELINFTKTLIGKRYLKQALAQPIINNIELNNRYNLIDNLIKDDNYDTLSKLLEDISDLERLIRRLDLETLHPYELNLLYLSFYQISKLITFCKDNKLFELNEKYCNVDKFNNYITSTFEINNIINLNFSNFNEFDNNIFKKNKYEQIDTLHEKIVSTTSFMDILKNELSNLIADDDNLLTLKNNDRDGYYLHITTKRCDILKTKLMKLKEIKVGTFKIKYEDLEFTPLPKSSYAKITCNKMKNISNELVVLKMALAKYTKELFKNELKYMKDNFSELFNYWSQKIGFIDFINSGAICSIKNHYSKPIIKEKDYSFFKAKELRHPIVELINTDFEYKPHNIELGENTEQNGILLYGINSSGKSTLMKSIGINIILAQIGYYVASKQFVYSPYKTLFTRINCNDNLYKGLSSFMVEMIEITSILKRNDKNTLVLGDELCKGSEITSANVIVAYLLKTLSENKASFITATHLHSLTTLPTVNNINNIKVKHIKLKYDENNDCLIYSRELLDGQGDSFYGLQVAKYMMKDSRFNEITSSILKEYNNENEVKQSNYNSNNYLIECQICKSKQKLETHHIEFQKNFNENLINEDKLHYQKDANYNLVTLCSECHDLEHNNKIIINGWKETSNGKELDYYHVAEVVKTTKYSSELVEYIKSLKLETNDPKMARIKIKETFNKKVSTASIQNLWN